MKIINLKEAEVVEVIMRPNEAIPLTVQFRLKDDAGNVVMHKTVQVKKEDMPGQAETAILTLVDKITRRLETLEGLV